MSIGIIDSGLGGYRIHLKLQEAYPHARFVFLADQANAPYGNKSIDELFEIASKNMNWFLSLNIKEVILACNTMSASILPMLKKAFPQMIFHDVIDPTIQNLPNHDFKKLLVLGTTRTIESQAYQNALKKRYVHTLIEGLAPTQLVSLIEGLSSETEIDAYLSSVIKNKDVDGLVLACTHYPMVAKNLSKIISAPLFDSEQAMVNRFKHFVFDEGQSELYTSADPSYADTQVKALFNQSVNFKKAVI
jgi:glutamate racemase